MSEKNLYDLFDEYGLAQHLEKVFFDLGMRSRGLLADDEKVRQAAKFAYEAMPFLLRTAIHATIGEDGFLKLVFQIRNGMIEKGGNDLSWLNKAQLQAALSSRQTVIQPEKLLPPPPQARPVTPQAFQFSGNSRETGSIRFQFPAGPELPGAATSQTAGIVGRDPQQCQFVIPAPSVSRVHARLKLFPGSGIGLADFGSTYGTFLEGRRLDQSFTLLPVRARIDLGGFQMTATAC